MVRRNAGTKHVNTQLHSINAPGSAAKRRLKPSSCPAPYYLFRYQCLCSLASYFSPAS